METNFLLKGLAEITYTPMTCFKVLEDNYEMMYSYPAIPYAETLIKNFPKSLLGSTSNIKLQISEQMLYFGYIKLSQSEFLIVGPLIEIPIDNQIAMFILKKLNLPLTQAIDLIKYWESTSHYSIYKFAKILTFINKLLNNEDLSTHDILPEEYTRNISDKKEEYKPVEKETMVRNSAQYESELFSYVYTGQYAKMKAFLKQTSYDGDIGTLSQSSMQQNKYLIVSSVVLASRAACYGGVSYETAMDQADFYIQKVDQATRFDELFDLHKQMLLNFAQLVSTKKLGKPASSLFYKVQNFIVTNLTEKITTEDIARHLKLNRAYLSSQFKKEIGINLVDYINMLKIDEAKRLLLTADIPLIDISNLLCFSSQSYFQTIFKKIVGRTPKDFKENMKWDKSMQA